VVGWGAGGAATRVGGVGGDGKLLPRGGGAYIVS